MDGRKKIALGLIVAGAALGAYVTFLRPPSPEAAVRETIQRMFRDCEAEDMAALREHVADSYN